MKRIIFFYFLVSAVAIVLISCVKHRGDIKEYIPSANIIFSSPATNAVYYIGDSVLVRAVAISSDLIHGYDVSIHKKGDTAALFFRHIHEHNDTLFINQKWGNEFTVATNLEAEVLLYLDHEGHLCSRKTEFRVQ